MVKNYTPREAQVIERQIFEELRRLNPLLSSNLKMKDWFRHDPDDGRIFPTQELQNMVSACYPSPYAESDFQKSYKELLENIFWNEEWNGYDDEGYTAILLDKLEECNSSVKDFVDGILN